MYASPFEATLQDYGGLPVDDHHHRQRKLEVTLVGKLDPELFADIDPEVKKQAGFINSGQISTTSFLCSGAAEMTINVLGIADVETVRSHAFPRVDLLRMSFATPPAKSKSKLGTYTLKVALAWDQESLVFIADAHRMLCEIALTKIPDKPEAQLTLDEAGAAEPTKEAEEVAP